MIYDPKTHDRLFQKSDPTAMTNYKRFSVGSEAVLAVNAFLAEMDATGIFNTDMSDTPPTDLEAIWIDTSNSSDVVVKMNNGTDWVPVTPELFSSSFATKDDKTIKGQGTKADPLRIPLFQTLEDAKNSTSMEVGEVSMVMGHTTPGDIDGGKIKKVSGNGNITGTEFDAVGNSFDVGMWGALGGADRNFDDWSVTGNDDHLSFKNAINASLHAKRNTTMGPTEYYISEDLYFGYDDIENPEAPVSDPNNGKHIFSGTGAASIQWNKRDRFPMGSVLHFAKDKGIKTSTVTQEFKNFSMTGELESGILFDFQGTAATQYGGAQNINMRVEVSDLANSSARPIVMRIRDGYLGNLDDLYINSITNVNNAWKSNEIPTSEFSSTCIGFQFYGELGGNLISAKNITASGTDIGIDVGVPGSPKTITGLVIDRAQAQYSNTGLRYRAGCEFLHVKSGHFETNSGRSLHITEGAGEGLWENISMSTAARRDDPTPEEPAGAVISDYFDGAVVIGSPNLVDNNYGTQHFKRCLSGFIRQPTFVIYGKENANQIIIDEHYVSNKGAGPLMAIDTSNGPVNTIIRNPKIHPDADTFSWPNMVKQFTRNDGYELHTFTSDEFAVRYEGVPFIPTATPETNLDLQGRKAPPSAFVANTLSGDIPITIDSDADVGMTIEIIKRFGPGAVRISMVGTSVYHDSTIDISDGETITNTSGSASDGDEIVLTEVRTYTLTKVNELFWRIR